MASSKSLFFFPKIFVQGKCSIQWSEFFPSHDLAHDPADFDLQSRIIGVLFLTYVRVVTEAWNPEVPFSNFFNEQLFDMFSDTR